MNLKNTWNFCNEYFNPSLVTLLCVFLNLFILKRYANYVDVGNNLEILLYLMFSINLLVTLSESALCKDKSRYCSNWKRNGYCSKTAAGYLKSFMKKNCQQSCGHCVTTTVATTTGARKITKTTGERLSKW